MAAHADPVFRLGVDGTVDLTNDAALRLLAPATVTAVLPALIETAREALTGGRARTVEFTTPDRKGRHYRARVTPFDLEPAATRTVVVTVTDLTEVKRAELFRSDFVANASHELRTPLAILLGFLETLTGSAADDPEAQKRFLPIMQQQASRMARLVDDLLALSRIELTEDAPPTAAVDVAEAVAVVAQALRLRAAERRIEIRLDAARNLPAALGDSEELGQVVQNLIDNSIKYAHAGSEIRVSVQRSTRLLPGIAVAVEDRSEGIAAHHLARLTERFYRVDTARSRAAGGTGLGLAIVKHIVNRHRGLLEIDSMVGRGSTFTVHIPAASSAPDARQVSSTFEHEIVG